MARRGTWAPEPGRDHAPGDGQGPDEPLFRAPEPDAFATAVLDWWRRHGRHDLPWQQQPTPYAVWISEIMLQQTRVSTVLPYFHEFLRRWPDVAALAAADEDEVLHAWTGLGYYSRARNLHRAARTVTQRHGGALPDTLDALQALPGIGRSTAGAILALGHGRRAPILDGNVKRVLARVAGVVGWPGRTEVQRRLWDLAETLTPDAPEQVGPYTQAMMDLGATLCVRRRPLCAACPVAEACVARAHGLQAQLPTPRPRRTLPHRHAVAWLVRAAPGLWLERRPAPGLWGGLWCPPQHEVEDPAQAARLAPHFPRIGPAAVRDLPTGTPRPLAPVQHAFTHFRLTLHPVLVPVPGPVPDAGRDGTDADAGLWYDGSRRVGLAAPIRRLVETVMQLEVSE